MDALHSVPLVASLLDQQRYSEALAILNNSIEVLAPVINDAFPDDREYTAEESLILSKFFLIKKEYRKSIEAALKAHSLLHNMDPIYQTAIRHRMMEQLLKETNKSSAPVKVDGVTLREFVLEMIKSDGLEPSYLGYLIEIKEYEILKTLMEKMILSEVDCSDIIDAILDMEYDGLMDIFIKLGNKMVENSGYIPFRDEDAVYWIHLIVEAYVYVEDFEGLKNWMMVLPWDKLYYTCFFIEDTYHLSISLPNENANFILSGDWKEEILSNFLFKNSKTSFRLIEGMSKARAPYISFCNSIMNAGTTNDTLFRNNKGLLSGREWNKFLDCASLGMIHQGNLNAFEILKEMLPSLESSNGEPGALMALGIMNARKRDKETTDFLLNWIDSQNNELVFGACMGIGLNMLESEDYSLYERLKQLLAVDNTIIQESAVYGIGMIMAGTKNDEVLRFLAELCETSDFPRVKRVCATATSLVTAMTASTSSFMSLSSNDASVRVGALLSLGAAFVSTSDLSIISKLLPFINDSDDDVKRAAVIAVALVGYEDYEIATSCLYPLAQSHSMHVRSAVALVLGFFNSGTGDTDSCSLLEALLYDSESLVRQNACIGMGCALAQMNPTLIPNYKRIMDRINCIVVLKGENSCVRIGAAIGRSLAEAGGRSAVFSLRNLSRQIEVKRVVGAVLFLQSWYWYPLMACVSLCMLPTPIFFFDENLDETKHIFENDSKFYDYLIRLPEVKRSRRGKQSRDGEKNTLCAAPQGLHSGDRLTYLERHTSHVWSVVLFKKNDNE